MLRCAVILLFIAAPMFLAEPSFAEQRCEGYTFNHSEKVICSATWRLQAKCTGKDMVHDWKISGRTTSPDSYIRPWLDYPITVVGYELLKIELPRSKLRRWFGEKRTDWWFMIGSTIQPDGMLSLGPGEVRASRFWPQGFSQPWPAKNGTAQNGHVGNLIDVHGGCFDDDVMLLLTIYYFG